MRGKQSCEMEGSVLAQDECRYVDGAVCICMIHLRGDV